MDRLHNKSSQLITAIFIGVTLFLLPTMGFALSHGTMTDCPSMEHGQSWCTMTFDDHLAIWQSTVTAVIPFFLLLTIAVCLILFIVTHQKETVLYARYVWPNTLAHAPPRLHNFLASLFSEGILHTQYYA